MRKRDLHNLWHELNKFFQYKFRGRENDPDDVQAVSRTLQLVDDSMTTTRPEHLDLP